jgi:hypothetical protein
MAVKNQRDFWAGIMFIVTGLAFGAGAYVNYSMGTAARPGPAYFPFGLGVILAVLGVMILMSGISKQPPDDGRISAFAWRPLAVIIFAVVLFGLLLPRLGLVVALPVLIIVSAWGGDEFHWIEAIILAVVLTVFSWLVFIKGLGLTIPVLPAFLSN